MEFKNRKPNRLLNYEYKDGRYFITICTKNKKEFFGKVINGKMKLSIFGEIVKRQWLLLEDKYMYVRLCDFVVMPNHFYGIIIIDRFNTGKNIYTGRDLSLQSKIKPLSELMGVFKTTSSKLIHQAGLKEFNWQRSFYDKIIRNDIALDNAIFYIRNNPLNWEKDRNNTENIFM